jgi:polyphenol oxidase
VAGGAAPVRERRLPGDPSRLAHPGWERSYPWLLHGITPGGDSALDLGLFGGTPVGEALARWTRLRVDLGMAAAAHARQVHGSGVLVHDRVPAGLHIADAGDGHVTAQPGLLLTVSVADCVPVSLVDPGRRAIALLHAGWRGIAAGIVDAGVRALHEAAGSRPGDLVAHLGPSICGTCYEVGPEVHDALGLVPPPDPRPVDLRAVLFDRLVAAGAPPHAITASDLCTRCGGGDGDGSRFFSHRGGSAGRQLALLALR